MPLFQGAAFAEFREVFDSGLPVSHTDAVRVVNEQTDIIMESLGAQMRTDVQRRQSVVFLLEQCIMLCSGMIPSPDPSSRKRFKRIRRAVERARRAARVDGM